MKAAKRVVISGGGTGGHVFPAIAIANALKQKDPNIEILFVGAKGKIEMEKVPAAGYPIKGLWISGLHRKLTLRNLLFPIKLLVSLFKAYRIIAGFKPHAVVGVGGYASGPTLEMAARKGIPCLIQEQNSYAGVTNRLLAKKAKTICVAYPNMDKTFDAQKIIVTGNPVRQDIWKSNNAQNEGFKYYLFDNAKKTVLVVGGSLGAKTLNEAMRNSVSLIKKNADTQFLWQAGKLYIDDYRDCETAQLPNVTIRAFIDRMDFAYQMADVVIARAGALTISELCLVGKPAILVPSPNVAEDHQTHNAMALVKNDAAIMIKDKDATRQMVATATQLLDDTERQKSLRENIKKMAKPNAAKDIAQAVLDMII